MSLLYMKSFRESEGSRRTTKTGGFGSSLFSKKFSSSSLGQNPHAQAQMAASGSAILQQQQQLTTRCDSPPGFFDEECPHHAVSRAELRARTFTPRARPPQFHSCCVVGRTSAQLKPQSSLVTASANKIRFLAAASLRRRRDDDEDDDDNDGGYRGGGGGGGGSAGFKDLRHACDDDERATMLQMYNNQKHKEKSGSKSVTFRKTDGRSGARSHNRHHAQQHHQQQQNASVAASTVAGAAVAAAATGSLVVGRRLLCADPAAGGTLSRQQSLQGNPGIKIGPLTVRDVESVAGLKGVESLASLTRDCFIIPAEKIGRFLPIGMMMPADGSLSSSINMIRVDESNLAFVINGLSSSMFPACSSVASGGSGRSSSECPTVAQRDGASRLVAKVRMDGKTLHGMLLMNMERTALYPFVSYFVINKLKVSPAQLSNKLYEDTAQEFECVDGRHHFVDSFEEVAMITRPPVSLTADRTQGLGSQAGFILSIFRVLPGNDGEKFERHWLYWTGARALYRSLPKCVGLKRISLLKSSGARGSVVYLLFVECSNLLENFVQAAQLLPALRARLCGYTGIYRMIENF